MWLQLLDCRWFIKNDQIEGFCTHIYKLLRSVTFSIFRDTFSAGAPVKLAIIYILRQESAFMKLPWAVWASISG